LTGERVERRLAAVLAADVAGYSRLMGANEEGTLARLKAVRKALVDPTIASYRGRIVKTTGDGMLVEFASAVDAARCGAEVQRCMAAQNADVPKDVRIEFRIGIHVGDIIIDDNDIFGDGVNIAARLEGIAEPGGVCISDDAQRQIRGKVDVAFEDMGSQNLKNIVEPMRAWRMRVGEIQAPAIENHSSAGSAAALALPDKPSIAVLPFQNMSGDPDQEYFADGMVEDIITALSRFKSLFVIARNSSFTYKGKAVDIKQVGRELGVRYVLEGSVRKAGSRVRITGQLIEAATGTHLWADRFDGELADVFDLQDRVTSSVVGVIGPKIEQIEIERVLQKPTNDMAAYDYYLRGIACFSRWTRADNDEAARMFSKAMQLDPDYAAVITWSLGCYNQRVMQQWVVDPEKEAADAVRLAKRGLELGRDDALVVAGAAITLMFTGEIDTAATLVDRAVQLNPNLAQAWSMSAMIRIVMGNPDLAVEHATKALQLDPLGSYRFQTTTVMAMSYFFIGRNEEALVWVERALAEKPTPLATLRIVAAVKATNGQEEDARQIARDIVELNPGDRISRMMLVRLLRRSDHRQRLVDALRLAGLPE
jgi:TolB-like protein/class 3 adenylate cyclase/tetratricopeptide (TPR) repeat protein